MTLFTLCTLFTNGLHVFILTDHGRKRLGRNKIPHLIPKSHQMALFSFLTLSV